MLHALLDKKVDMHHIVLAVGYIICYAIGWVAWHAGRGSAKHEFHGLCNSGVGQPYGDFLRQLHAAVDATSPCPIW